jgi:hypothetical protein
MNLSTVIESGILILAIWGKLFKAGLEITQTTSPLGTVVESLVSLTIGYLAFYTQAKIHSKLPDSLSAINLEIYFQRSCLDRSFKYNRPLMSGFKAPA